MGFVDLFIKFLIVFLYTLCISTPLSDEDLKQLCGHCCGVGLGGLTMLCHCLVNFGKHQKLRLFDAHALGTVS